MAMGQHSDTEGVTQPRQSRLRHVVVTYCQPFYKRYRKFIVAALGAAFVTFQSVVTDGVTNEEWLTILIAAATAAGVWRVPNATNQKVIK